MRHCAPQQRLTEIFKGLSELNSLRLEIAASTITCRCLAGGLWLKYDERNSSGCNFSAIDASSPLKLSSSSSIFGISRSPLSIGHGEWSFHKRRASSVMSLSDKSLSLTFIALTSIFASSSTRSMGSTLNVKMLPTGRCSSSTT